MRDDFRLGGYLVTVGVYTGPEDYNLKVVRQLQVGAIFELYIPDKNVANVSLNVIDRSNVGWLLSGREYRITNPIGLTPSL